MNKIKKFTIFYSWQSDLPNDQTRGAIKKSLHHVAASIEDSESNLSLIVDEATREVSGAPNIPGTILEKIEESDLFIADITTINSDYEGRKAPNPNVVFELGYAVSILGWNRIILIMNESFGSERDLPFDFAQHRVSKYKVNNGRNLKKLDGLLNIAIKAVIDNQPEKPKLVNQISDTQIKKNRDIKNLEWLISSMHLPTLKRYTEEAPRVIKHDILYFKDELQVIYESPLFHVYDSSLSLIVEKMIEFLMKGLSHGTEYKEVGNDPGYYLFSSANEFFTPEESETWQTLLNEVAEFSKALDSFIHYVRVNYITIDIDALSSNAWKSYVDYKEDLKNI